MNTLYGLIERLIQLSIENKLITSRDSIYMRNRLLDAFCETDYEQTAPCETNLYETLDQLAHIAIQMKLKMRVISHILTDLLSFFF